MVQIIDTFPQIGEVFCNGRFDLKRWREYINTIYRNTSDIFEDDLQEYIDSGSYTYEDDILPILNRVQGHPFLETLHTSFVRVTKGLNQRIIDCFAHELEIDIVLYLGLCNAAGWVTNINGRDVILLGIEKILELSWYDEDSMYGLIYHELGHIYHKQYGAFEQEGRNQSQNFIWQLFTEGIAMYFEQPFLLSSKQRWMEKLVRCALSADSNGLSSGFTGYEQIQSEVLWRLGGLLRKSGCWILSWCKICSRPLQQV